MNESAAYEAIRPHLVRWKMDPQRVENVLTAGTPDTNYSGGWIEMKYMPDWPKRPATLIKLMEDRPEQAVFLYRRWSVGGAAFIMLRVGKHLYLFAGLDAPTIRKGLTRAQMMDICCWNSAEHPLAWLKAWLQFDDGLLPAASRARFLRLCCNYTLDQAEAVINIPRQAILAGETHDNHPATNDLIDAWVA